MPAREQCHCTGELRELGTSCPSTEQPSSRWCGAAPAGAGQGVGSRNGEGLHLVFWVKLVQGWQQGKPTLVRAFALLG